MPKKFTARFVDSVALKEKRVDYRDGHTRGLILRVTPNGNKSWSVSYTRRSDGRKRRCTIGRYPDFSLEEARIEAQDVLSRVARGEDPAGDKQAHRGAYTFEDLARTWVERHGKRKKNARSLYDDELMLKREILPAIGGMKADDVTKRDVIRIIDAVAKRGAHYRSNRVLALTRSIFRWGCAKDLIKFDPTHGVRPRTVERSRDHVLNNEEIRIFWNALDDAPMSKAVVTMLRLALVTGQRIGEIAGTRKSEIELTSNEPIWTLPGGRTKNQQVNRVPLSGLAVELLEDAILASGDSEFVFPSPTGNGPITAHAATRAISRARPKIGIGNFRVHDLRRTVATSMASLEINPHTISLVLNHISVSKGTITDAVYIKYSFDREKRFALAKWAGRLREIVSGEKQAKVIEFTG